MIWLCYVTCDFFIKKCFSDVLQDIYRIGNRYRPLSGMSYWVLGYRQKVHIGATLKIFFFTTICFVLMILQIITLATLDDPYLLVRMLACVTCSYMWQRVRERRLVSQERVDIICTNMYVRTSNVHVRVHVLCSSRTVHRQHRQLKNSLPDVLDLVLPTRFWPMPDLISSTVGFSNVASTSSHLGWSKILYCVNIHKHTHPRKRENKWQCWYVHTHTCISSFYCTK